MPNRDSLIITILISLILLTSFSIYIVFDKHEAFNFISVGKRQIAEDYVNPPVAQVLGADDIVEEELVFSTLSICYEQHCKIISPKVIQTFYINNELDVQSLYMYILEYVVPYFEGLSGGKELVKNSKGSFYALKEDSTIDMSNIYKDIANLLEESGTQGVSLKQELYKKESPGTDGKYAPKYIEIDNSRQKLYAWEDGEVTKEIELSAAKAGWEVYGVFPIVDKGLQPMAPSGNYMPYWMAFYYSPSQASWYGLHGLVWWYDDDGNVVYENTDYIGERRSQGCIRMLKDDAKYLYDRYEKGDPILIHE
jgi:lipoprotein-anchoring transpeptidase ErfK/SrfK